MPVVNGYQTTSAGSGTDGDTLVVTSTGSIAYAGDAAIFMSGDNQRTTIFGEVFAGTGRAILSQGDNAKVYVAEGANVSGVSGIQTGDNALVQNAGTIQSTNGGYAVSMNGRLENSGTIIGSIGLAAQSASLQNLGTILGGVQAYDGAHDDMSFSGVNAGYMLNLDSRAATTTFDNSGTIDSVYAENQLQLFNTGKIGSLRFDDGAGYIVNNGYIGGTRSDFSSVDDYYDGRNGVITGRVSAGAGNDKLLGGQQSDTFDGGLGTDTLFGYGGDDVLYGGDGDRLAGGTGDDLYLLSLSATGSVKLTERLDEGIDTVQSYASYTLGANMENLELLAPDNSKGIGNSLDNLISGAGTNNYLDGKAGADEVHGDAGNDTLVGGKGIDELYGEGDLDTFVFLAGDTAKTKAGADTIHDFLRSEGDRIDLSHFDANAAKKGIQDFDFIGKDAFSKTEGELRFDKQGADTWIYGDVNGDGKADFIIHLESGVTLKAGDFLL